MQNKSKFKVGDEMYSLNFGPFANEYCQKIFVKIEEVLNEHSRVYRPEDPKNIFILPNCNLFTKEEAIIKLQEFLNAK